MLASVSSVGAFEDDGRHLLQVEVLELLAAVEAQPELREQVRAVHAALHRRFDYICEENDRHIRGLHLARLDMRGSFEVDGFGARRLRLYRLDWILWRDLSKDCR